MRATFATARHVVLYAATSIWDVLVAWPGVLLIYVLWGENLRWENRRKFIPFRPDGKPAPGGPVLTCSLWEGSFPVTRGRWPKGFYLQRIERQRRSHYVSWGGTTLGHAVFYGPGRTEPGMWTPLQEHEIGVHVEQYEASMLHSLIVGAAVALAWQTSAGIWLGVAIWATGFLQMLAANWTTAWLRGEDPYRGSAHEEAAYAIEELYGRQRAQKE